MNVRGKWQAPMRRLTLVAVAAVLGLAVLATGAAQGEATARIEVRVWQDVGDEREIHVSARPADGSWRTLGTIPLPLEDGVSSAGDRYGEFVVDVPLVDWAEPRVVHVRVWQNVHLGSEISIGARPASGLWSTLGRLSLPLDDGFSSSGRYRYGDVAFTVSLPEEQVRTLAGAPRIHGYVDGPSETARFGRFGESSMGLEVDRDGSVVVADFRNRAIRRVLPDGTVTTIAGGNGSGTLDGPAEIAQFEGPTDVAIDPQGNIYVADCRGHRIRRVTPEGMVTTVAGGERAEDGMWRRVDGPAEEARFVAPCHIALDRNGDIYITEQYTIRRVSPSGWVSTFAGGSGLGYVDGPRRDAEFAYLEDIGIDAGGTLYVLDTNPFVREGHGPRYAVRKIDATGSVSPVFRSDIPTVGGTLVSPSGMAVSPGGEIYLTNTGRHQIVKVLGLNGLQALAGSGEDGHMDGLPVDAALSEPGALALSPGGALVVVDQADSVVRVVLPQSDGSFASVEPAEAPKFPRLEGVQVDLFTGQGGPGVASIDGYLDGPARQALFDGPRGMALAPDGSVIVADTDNKAIRRISPEGIVSTVAGANGAGLRDGPPGEAQFRRPFAVAVDSDGAIYVADDVRFVAETGDYLIRKIAPNGEVSTVDMKGGPFYNLGALALDAVGNVLFTESGHGRIRRLLPDGEVSTVVDLGNAYISGLLLDDEGTLFFAARLHEEERTTIQKVGDDGAVSRVFQGTPRRFGRILSTFLPGLALAPDGMLYVADWSYGRVVQVSPDGEAVIVIGRDSSNNLKHFNPSAILVTPEGDLLVADSSGSVIWKITLPEE